MAFKRMKSLAGLDQLEAKKPELAQAWIFAKLILFLIAEQNAGQVPDSPPVDSPTPDASPSKPVASPSRWRLTKLALANIRSRSRVLLQCQMKPLQTVTSVLNFA